MVELESIGKGLSEASHGAPVVSAEPHAESGALLEPGAISDDGALGFATEAQLLFAGSPREVLSRIVNGDPLGVRARIAKRLRSDAWLLDADRVELRVLARCARLSARYRGRPEFGAWLDAIVCDSIQELNREDHEALRSGRLSGAQASAAFSALARPLELDPDAMRRACTVFNRLPAAERTALVELAVRARSLDEISRELGESAVEIARRARRALDVFLQIQPGEKAP